MKTYRARLTILFVSGEKDEKFGRFKASSAIEAFDDARRDWLKGYEEKEKIKQVVLSVLEEVKGL